MTGKPEVIGWSVALPANALVIIDWYNARVVGNSETIVKF
jgi:hypothetical protein